VRANSNTKSGSFTRTWVESTGNAVVAHLLWQTPRLVEFHFINADAGWSIDGIGHGTYDGTTNQCIGKIDNGASAEWDLDTTKCIHYMDSSGNWWTATATMDATNITLAFTEGWTANDLRVIRVAHA
jgi:hypothetical protein